MHVRTVIVGGGVIGVAAAYLLKRRGHDVTVIERQAGPGQETSFANASLLTPGMPEPWNAPGIGRVLLRSLMRSDSAVQLRLKALPSVMHWGLDFLRHSRAAPYERSTISNLRLALYSLAVMKELESEAPVEYAHTARGSLKIFRNTADLDRAVHTVARLAPHGLACLRLSTQELLQLEPALVPIGPALAGALHYPGDETGDAHRFCVGMTRHARAHGVKFCLGTTVTAIEPQRGKIAVMREGGDHLIADNCVVAAGAYSTSLLRPLGLRLPVQPVKGYSLTFEGAVRHGALQFPIVDDRLHACVVPIGGAVRVAGTAEFAGYDLSLPELRLRNLWNLLREILPDWPLQRSEAKPWCGLRSMSPDGVPIIGATPVPNLWVSTGHGHLGWTMASGSARLLTDLICSEPPQLESSAYGLARFSTSASGR